MKKTGKDPLIVPATYTSRSDTMQLFTKYMQSPIQESDQRVFDDHVSKYLPPDPSWPLLRCELKACASELITVQFLSN